MFRRPRLRVADEACELIHSIAAHRTDGLETGGALFGFDHGATGELLVSEATGPGPDALHEPTRFERDLDYTHRRALEIYERTRAEWVGEWHTHPRGGLEPSPVDLTTYLGHLADPDLRFDRFAAIIVVPTQRNLHAIAWEITSNRARGRRLRLNRESR